MFTAATLSVIIFTNKLNNLNNILLRWQWKLKISVPNNRYN